jgi:hypothetical protein
LNVIQIINIQEIYLQKYTVYNLIFFVVIFHHYYGILINRTRDIAEAFSKHFQLVYSSSYPGIFPLINQSTEVLSLALLLNSDIHGYKTVVSN